jgi:Pyruvate/2-oxoacid:ferredoxin oxidoreductase delta subunit
MASLAELSSAPQRKILRCRAYAAACFGGFADLLLDIYTLVKPHISLLDAVIGMEGNGPGSGDAVQLGFIAASGNALALDDSVAGILNTPDIPVLRRARARNLLAEYENLGEIPEKRSIILPEPPRPSLTWGVYFPVRLREYLRKKMVSYPVVDKKLCVGCKLCVQKCPPQSLTMKNGKPVFRYQECIRCFCCQEYCPQGAITSGKTGLMRFADTLEKLFRRGKRR